MTAAAKPPLYSGVGSTPVPDPTFLTGQQIGREVGSLEKLIVTRLDAMDEAVRLLREDSMRVPVHIDKSLHQLKELNAEKFNGIAVQFHERDLRADQGFRSIANQFLERDARTEQTSKDSKIAVDAALQAAKEAVVEQNKSFALASSKSEASTTKQIDSMGTLITTSTAALDSKIADIKDRLTLIEGRSSGQAATTVDNRQSTSLIVAIVVAAASLMSLGFAVLAR